MKRSVIRAKRTLDVLGALGGLCLLAPLVPFVALAIKLDAPGPVFFRQRRVGIDRRAGPRRKQSDPAGVDGLRRTGVDELPRTGVDGLAAGEEQRTGSEQDGRIAHGDGERMPGDRRAGVGPDGRRAHDAGGKMFDMIKFRTMREDAEAIAGPAWTADHDPRITRVGAILRKTKIDELPQLWNVLRGQMSLVGPRPETPHFVDKLTSELPVYRERVAGVKTGITGLAQVHCEDDGSFFSSLREKIYFDLLYGANLLRMEHWYEVIALDFRIMMMTLRRLLEIRKTIDKDVIRIELPRRFEHVGLAPAQLAGTAPAEVRVEVLDNPDKITVWWYLPKARAQAPPQRDSLGLHLLRELSDQTSYLQDVGGRGVNELRVLKRLKPREGPAGAGARAATIDTIKLEAPSKIHFVTRVEEFLAPLWEHLATRSPDPHFAFTMGLLVLEALTNVIKHAHADSPEKRIPVEILVGPGEVEVKVLDYGAGFDLDAVEKAPVDGWLANVAPPGAAGGEGRWRA